MVGRRLGKKKDKSNVKKTNIAAALVPTAAFLSVPRTPPPQDADPEYTSGPLASGLLSSTMLGRLFAQPDWDDNNDVDTSIDDYTDARNLRLEERERLPTPTDDGYMLAGYGRDGADNDSERITSIYQSAEQFEPSIDIPTYAVIHKKSSRYDTDDEDESLPRPSPKLPTSSTIISQAHPDEEIVEEQITAQVAPAKDESAARDVFESLDKVKVERVVKTHTAPAAVKFTTNSPRVQADTPRTASFRRQNDALIRRQEELEKRLLEHEEKQTKLFEYLENTGGREPSPEQTLERDKLIDEQATLTDHTLKDQDDLIKTLQDRIFNLEAEKAENEDTNTQLQGEIEAFREYVQEREGGAAADVADAIRLKRQVQDLKDENSTLKSAVQRLNQELSRMQAKYRNVESGNNNLVGLPSKGPVPTWLINTKYLAPLFLVYDDRLEKKEALIRQYEDEMETFSHRVEEVVKENERLHIRLEQTAGALPVAVTEWSQLQEQAMLVLEENQLLLEQLDVQNDKTKQMNAAHIQEISKLTKRSVMLESDKQDLENALKEVKDKCSSLNAHMQSTLIERDMSIALPEHQSAIVQIKKTIEEMNRSHQEELLSLTSRLESMQAENKNVKLKLTDLSCDKDQLEVEHSGLKKSYRKLQKRELVLRRVLEEVHGTKSAAQHYLTSVVQVAERTAIQRDAYAQLIKDQENERKKSLKTMSASSAVISQVEQKLKDYKAKAAKKISAVMNKMKDQEESFKQQRQEYERELRQLRLMVNDREGLVDLAKHEKKLVEEELESMWQAASNDNRRMRATMERTYQRLRQHKQLEAQWNNDDELKTFLGHSDDVSSER